MGGRSQGKGGFNRKDDSYLLWNARDKEGKNHMNQLNCRLGGRKGFVTDEKTVIQGARQGT